GDGGESVDAAEAEARVKEVAHLPNAQGVTFQVDVEAAARDREQRKIREVLVEPSCYLVDGLGATIAANDDTVPDNDADANEERARTSRFQGRCEEADPIMVAGLLWYRGADQRRRYRRRCRLSSRSSLWAL